MRDLGRKDASRQVWPDDDVVGDGVCRGGLTVNRAWFQDSAGSDHVKGPNEKPPAEAGGQPICKEGRMAEQDPSIAAEGEGVEPSVPPGDTTVFKTAWPTYAGPSALSSPDQ